MVSLPVEPMTLEVPEQITGSLTVALCHHIMKVSISCLVQQQQVLQNLQLPALLPAHRRHPFLLLQTITEYHLQDQLRRYNLSTWEALPSAAIQPAMSFSQEEMGVIPASISRATTAMGQTAVH